MHSLANIWVNVAIFMILWLFVTNMVFDEKMWFIPERVEVLRFPALWVVSIPSYAASMCRQQRGYFFAHIIRMK